MSRLGVVMAFICLLCSFAPCPAQQKTLLVRRIPGTVVANAIIPPELRLLQQQQQEEVKSEDEMGTSGFFLGIIGMLAGAAVGSQIGQSACPAEAVDKDCMGRHAYTGALIAGTVFTPLGVHLANKQPKHLPLSLALSALTGTALYFGFKAIPGSPIAMAPFLATPLQVFMSIKLERGK